MSQSPPDSNLPSHQAVAAAIDAVEAEMKQVGVWEIEEPTPGALAAGGAFGTKSMAFEQWLRWIFVPRVRQILDEHGPFPPKSQVSQQAYREWRMWSEVPEMDPLLERLREFDALFNG